MQDEHIGYFRTISFLVNISGKLNKFLKRNITVSTAV